VGNHLFPTVIEVTDRAVIRHKRSWFSKDEISISITKVASVHIKTGMIWSNILIESSGGTDPLASMGTGRRMHSGSGDGGGLAGVCGGAGEVEVVVRISGIVDAFSSP